MRQCRQAYRPIRHNRRGFVLILTLMILIVLVTLVYQLTLKLSDRRRADDYLIYYQQARYACDSGLKYAMVTPQIVEPNYADRTVAPDFSDLFMMSDDQVDEMLAIWAERMNAEWLKNQEQTGQEQAASDANDMISVLKSLVPEGDPNLESMLKGVHDISEHNGLIDANELVVPGPYGPEWPLLVEPIEFEIGTAKVRITIEDENAKLPLVWLTNTDKQLLPVTKEILRVYCSWYGINEKDVTDFRTRLAKVSEIKPFNPNATAFSSIVPTTVSVGSAAAVIGPTSASTPARTARGTAATATPQTAPAQPGAQMMRVGLKTYSDYSRLMKTTYLNADWLTLPVFESQTRKEYPLKYLGIWGSTKVNINTAPRHVLEAAFAFGGDGDKIADAIIRQRQEKPFASIDDFRRQNIGYGGQIQKCENYITTQSDVFTIRIVATDGPARCTATAAVLRQGRNITKINAVFE